MTIAFSLAPVPEPVSPARLSVSQYHAMIASGILTDSDPIELLEGCLITKMPKNPPHSISTGLLLDALLRLLPLGWSLRIQEPITLTESEPEPDAAIVRGARRDYLARHPLPEDIAVVIEVADATLPLDRKWKKRLYAVAGIPVYWVINLQANVIEIYTNPDASGYQAQELFRKTDMVPVIIDGQSYGTIPATDLLP